MAYQIDDITCDPDYKNCIFCSCCDICRQICHEAKLENM